MPRPTPSCLIQVGVAAHSRRQETGHAEIAAPELSHIIAELAVPLAPALAVREPADLVQSRRIPRLGDQLGVGEHAILGNRFDYRWFDHHLAGAVAAEDRREVEAKAIYMHVADPVAQAGHEQVADDGVV